MARKKTEKVVEVTATELPERLSTHFTVREFTKSQTGVRLGISNKMTPEAFENAKALCENVLEHVRKYFGPVNVNSGYRGPELNKAIGGAKTSQHMTGEAADIEVGGVSNYNIARFIQEQLDFDQLILEFYIPGRPDSGWVHVSFKRDGKNRKEVLTINRNGTFKGLLK